MTGSREGQGNSVPVEGNPRREAPRSKLTNLSTSTDLLVCFPSRTRLPLIPTRVCIPAQPLNDPFDPLCRRRFGQLGRSYSAVGLGRASPLLRSKVERRASEIAEPTSPRVTCSGQIRVRPSTAATACRSLRSDVKEIERIRDSRTKRSIRKKSLGWLVNDQVSKEDTTRQPSTCSRRTWFDLRCFGSFPESQTTGDARGYENRQNGKADAMGTMFAKWFMVLQQDNHDTTNTSGVRGKDIISVVDARPSDPLKNALPLMRCRSTPNNCWSEETESDRDCYEGGNDTDRGREEDKDGGDLNIQKVEDDLVMTRFNSTRFSGVSQEDGRMVDGLGPNQLTRSKSWKPE